MDKSYRLRYPFESSVFSSLNTETDCDNRGFDCGYVLESSVL